MIHRLIPQRDITAPACSAAYLARLYEIPNPFRTRDAFDRFHHLDVPMLTENELGREIRCVERRLDYETDVASVAWLTERVVTLQRERARRSRAKVRHAR